LHDQPALIADNADAEAIMADDEVTILNLAVLVLGGEAVPELVRFRAHEHIMNGIQNAARSHVGLLDEQEASHWLAQDRARTVKRL
jgi:hypothetical protein